jgi:hypothetical protein
VRVVVVFVEVGFGSFGEVFHLIGHGVGFAVGNTVGLLGIAGAFYKILVGAGFFGGVEGGENAGVVVTEEVVVVGVCEFVEDEVWHAAGFFFEVVDAGELNGFGELDGEVVVLQPGGAGVVAGATLAIGRGREVEGNFFEVSDGGGRDAVDDGLELLSGELEGAFEVRVLEILVDEDGPAEVVLDGVTGGRGEVGVVGDAEVGGEDVAELGENLCLLEVEGGEEGGGGDRLVDFEGGFGFEVELKSGVVWLAALEEGDGGFISGLWCYFFFELSFFRRERTRAVCLASRTSQQARPLPTSSYWSKVQTTFRSLSSSMIWGFLSPAWQLPMTRFPLGSSWRSVVQWSSISVPGIFLAISQTIFLSGETSRMEFPLPVAMRVLPFVRRIAPKTRVLVGYSQTILPVVSYSVTTPGLSAQER